MNDHLFGKELFIRFTANAFRKLPSIYVFSYFPFGFEGRMWDLIVSVPDHCLSFYFGKFLKEGNRPVICRFASKLNTVRLMKNRRLLKGSVYVIKEDLTYKNQKLLQDVSEVENVKTAWSDQGKIIALLETEKGEGSPKVVVTLKTDLSLPLVLAIEPMNFVLSTSFLVLVQPHLVKKIQECKLFFEGMTIAYSLNVFK